MLKRLFSKIGTILREALKAVRPGPVALRGAAAGALAAGIVTYAAYALAVTLGPLVFTLPAILVMLLLGALLLLLGQGIAWLIGALARIPWGYRWSALAALAMMYVALMGMKPPAFLAVAGFAVACASLLGAGIASAARGWGNLTRVQRGAAVGGMAAGGLLLAGALFAYAAWRGAAAQPVVDAAKQSGAPLERVRLPDPAQPGSFAVRTLTYGSGSDRYRPEFGEDADLVTQPVNGAKLLQSSWKGLTGQIRTFAWGFDFTALPLNGRVWYPEGEGPFPLVVMVHGNHNMTDFSDPGYGYLGELLASRGYIFVSVDENFINGGVVDLFDSFTNENDARGWLLLEHLRQWHAWNRDASSPFYQMLDTGRIAVAGHSRGGEAAAVAAAFNRLPYYPDDYGLAFDYHYGIRAVAAIAPVDGQYNPAQRPTVLDGVSYFVIQGSHDSDMTSFDGLDLFERVRLEPGSGLFKSAVYVYRANHGQYNTTWGDSDLGGLYTGFLNRGALLSAEEQRQTALVYLSAFFDSALKGETGYLPLFQDARAAPEGWLPDTVYISRFEQAGDILIAGYEEDADLTTLTLEGATARGEGFTAWREQRVHTKWGEREASAVYLGWNEAVTAKYTLALPTAGLDLGEDSALIFALGDANLDPDPAPGIPQENETGKSPAPRQPIDLSVALADASGETAQVILSDYHMVQPQLEAELFKLKLFEKYDPAEPVLQSYALPLADFVKVNPAFDPRSVRSIRFIFDRTRRGSVILDGVGLRIE